jgi:CrcB protein
MLGGFTTFSTFGYDTLALGRDIGLTLAALNIFAHIALGLGAALLGLFLARWF